MAAEYRLCDGPKGCGRRIPVGLFDRANMHAPGCRRRRSALAKATLAKKRERRERLAARRAAKP